MIDIEVSALEHCSGRQLKRLLKLAYRGEEVTRNLLLEVGDPKQLERLLDEIYTGTGQPARNLLQAVCSPDTPLDDLREIRSAAKRLVVAVRGPRPKAAATLLYHLAIACALGRYGQNISSKDPAERLELYKYLASELSDEELAAVFANAVAALMSPKPWSSDKST
jgi:hypothetical protein